MVKKIRNMTGMSVFTTLIQHSTGSLSHRDQTRRRNKRHPNWKGGNETVTVCRWHDSVHRKPYRLQKKVLNLIRECGRVVTTESTFKINGILVHKQWTIRKRKKENNFICYHNEKSKLTRNKFNQGGKRHVLRKLGHWSKKLSNT